MAIRSFKSQATEDISYGRTTKRSRRILPAHLHQKARIKLARLAATTSLSDLKSLPGNRFEALRGNRKGQHSIRVNDQYRICFKWENQCAVEIEIVDYH